MLKFNNVNLADYVQINDIRRDISPPKNLVMQELAGLMGAYFSRSETGVRVVEVDVTFVQPNKEALRTAVREFSRIINTDELQEMVFLDEPHLRYFGILSGETPIEQTMATGQSTLQFTIPDPIATGATRTKTFNVYDTSLTFIRNSEAYMPNGVTKVGANVPRFISNKLLLEDSATNSFTDSESLELHDEYEVIPERLVDNGTTKGSGVYHYNITRQEGLPSDRRLRSDTIKVQKNVPSVLSFDLKLIQGYIQFYFTGTAVDDFPNSEKLAFTINADGTVDGLYGVTLLEKVAVADGYTRYFIFLPQNFFNNGSGFDALLEQWHGWADAGTFDYYYRKPMWEFNKRSGSTYTPTTRQAEQLKIPTEFNLKRESGSWEHRFNVDTRLRAKTDGGYIFFVPTASNGEALSLRYNGSLFELTFGGKTHTFGLIDGYNEVAVSWDSTQVDVVINGEVFTTDTAHALPVSIGNWLWVGSNQYGAMHANTLHDTVRIANVKRTASELISAYNKTWGVDAKTSVLIDFNGNLNVKSPTYQADNSIDVEGTVDPYPIFTIRTLSEASEFKITHINSGEFLRLLTTIRPNDVIVIDCKTNNVTINGQRALQYLDIDSVFFALETGLNRFSFTQGLTVELIADYDERWS